MRPGEDVIADDETVMVTSAELDVLLARDREIAAIDDAPTSPVMFDPERHIQHARICPSCSRLLQRCDTGWTCEHPECPVTLTDEEMARLLGRQTQPRIEAP